MMSYRARVGIEFGGLALVLVSASGCAMSADEMARQFIADMDARPPAERVPNWEHTRALMMRDAPKVGELAPDFELQTWDGKETIRLSQFRGEQPVVLVFGSWT